MSEDVSNTVLTITDTISEPEDQPNTDPHQELIEAGELGKIRYQNLFAAVETDVLQHIQAQWLHHDFDHTDVPTQHRIMALASVGCTIKGIAAGVGLSERQFNVQRKAHPEIDKYIAWGRHVGEMKVRSLTWDAATNIRDNARSQELARLHRMFETEESPDTEGARIEETPAGWTLTVIKKKTGEAPSGEGAA